MCVSREIGSCGQDSTMISLKSHAGQALHISTRNQTKSKEKFTKLQARLRISRRRAQEKINLQQTKVMEDNMEKDSDKLLDVHAKALEDLANVNSLFTIAVFIGLSFASPNQHSLEIRPGCDPDTELAKALVMYEVLSFTFFLVSSLAATSLKILLNFYKIRYSIRFILKASSDERDNPSKSIVLSVPWRYGLMLISATASAIGIFFLTLSMVNVIQIRLGKLSCGSVYAYKSVIIMSVMLALSLVAFYLPPAIFSILTTAKK